MKKSEDNLKDLQDMISKPIHILWESQQLEEREEEAESLFKQIMSKTFPDLKKDMDIQIHEA